MVECHHHHGLCGLGAAEREFIQLRAQSTAKAKAVYHMVGVCASYGGGGSTHHMSGKGFTLIRL